MIHLAHKLPELDQKLISLLEELDPEDWHKQTVARLWKVKDVVAHLLDGNIRILSGLRDGHTFDGPETNSYEDLLDFLNTLNAQWVQAMKRVSPSVLIELLKQTGGPFCAYYASLDPMEKAVFPVAWTGEQESKNWMHIAREYTEKFLHQQQIRDAVGKQGIINEAYYLPFLDVCMYALPHTLREVKTAKGNAVRIKITGDVRGTWIVVFNGESWARQESIPDRLVVTEVSIDAYAAWKLFSKSLRPHELQDKISMDGDHSLGKVAVEMVSFMA